MKSAVIVVVLLVAWILIYGSPFATDVPQRDYHYGSTELILPMSFAHVDHNAVSCVECHHNYVDDTGIEPCMYCHMTDSRVSDLLEEQFHELCRGCHEDHAARNEAGGPPRQCIACHLGDDRP
jgi:predicted CXXCH cytochrome family protein